MRYKATYDLIIYALPQFTAQKVAMPIKTGEEFAADLTASLVNLPKWAKLTDGRGYVCICTDGGVWRVQALGDSMPDAVEAAKRAAHNTAIDLAILELRQTIQTLERMKI